MFSGADFPLFLQRYKRWLKAAGLENLDDEGHRVWLMTSMDQSILAITEGIYGRTATFQDLVQELARTFPVYATDFSLRADVAAIPALGASPSVEDLERLIVSLELKWTRMSPEACSDQEKMVVLSNKLSDNLWRDLRQSPFHRGSLVSYDKMKEALRSLVAEQQMNELLNKLREPARVMVLQEKPSKPPRPSRDKSQGAVFKAKVSCHFCGKTGHYKADCWHLHPEKRPKAKTWSTQSSKFVANSSSGAQARFKPKIPQELVPQDSRNQAPRPKESEDQAMEDQKMKKRPRQVLAVPKTSDAISAPILQMCIPKSGGSSGTLPRCKRHLLQCNGEIWGKEVQFVVDSGAALEGALSCRLLPEGVHPSQNSAKTVMVGDGRTIWTLGDIVTNVNFGCVNLKVTFTVFETKAFDALLGVKFLRRPEVKAFYFHPPSCWWTPHTKYPSLTTKGQVAFLCSSGRTKLIAWWKTVENVASTI